MKTRLDFVSNSSSCSFIVSLSSEDDVKAFKELIPVLKDMDVGLVIYDSLNAANIHNGFILNSGDELKSGYFVQCYSGEDHETDYYEKYIAMKDVFDKNMHEFKLYADSFAHLTVDEDLPEEDPMAYFWKEHWD